MKGKAPSMTPPEDMTKAPKAVGAGAGSRNFGKPDHMGTTNVRSAHVNSIGPAIPGSKHIDSMPMGGGMPGAHINSIAKPPAATGGGYPPVSMSDNDADDASVLRSVPLKGGRGWK